MPGFWSLLICCLAVAVADNLLVQTQQGTIRGHLLTSPQNTTFKAFQGVPFAEPPIGSLRFQAPRPPLPWKGILDVTADSNICFTIEHDTPYESEDCLYLNVFTPNFSKANETKLPVLLWLHGGGYSHGTVLNTTTSPDYLVEADIIVITINYRLGPFGFLATGDTVIPGNAGHKDQAAAIKWTYDNIASFGGDPEKITISGGSAGGSSAGYQLLYKKNEGLFRAAILQSGSPLSQWSFMESSRAREYAFDLANQINSSVDVQNDTTLLRDYLLSVDSIVLDRASAHTVISRPLPVIEPEHDGAFLVKEQYELLIAGDFIRVPILIGTTSEEEIHQASNLVSLQKYLDRLENNPERFIPNDFVIKSGVNTSLIGTAIRDLYLEGVADEDKLGHVVRAMSHGSFTLPMIKHADLAANFTDVYFYVFSYDGPMGNVNITIKGADRIGHGEESRYMWKQDDSTYSNSDLSIFPASDVLTLRRVVSLWSNFVKFVNPTPTKSDLLQNIRWPTFLQNEYKYLDIGPNLEVKIKPKNPYYTKWSQFYDDWAQRPFKTF